MKSELMRPTKTEIIGSRRTWLCVRGVFKIRTQARLLARRKRTFGPDRQREGELTAAFPSSGAGGRRSCLQQRGMELEASAVGRRARPPKLHLSRPPLMLALLLVGLLPRRLASSPTGLRCDGMEGKTGVSPKWRAVPALLLLVGLLLGRSTARPSGMVCD